MSELEAPAGDGWEPLFKDHFRFKGWKKGDVKVASAAEANAYDEFRNAPNTGLARMTDKQAAEIYMYESTSHVKKFGGQDIRPSVEVKTRALDMDKRQSLILSIVPELQENPQALLRLAAEPYLEERLRGMAKARDWLAVRADAISLAGMPESHQDSYWRSLPEIQKAAYRRTGYMPPAEQFKAPKEHHFKFGLDKLDDIASYAWRLGPGGIGADDVFNNTLKPAASGAMEVMNAGTNAAGTLWRVSHHHADSKYDSDGWWSRITHEFADAWHGESFIREANRKEALDILEGDQSAYDLVARMSAGDSIDDIVGQYADEGTEAYGKYYARAQRFQADPIVQKAMAALERGKTSFGRSLADLLPEVHIGPVAVGGRESNLYTVVSSAGDATWTLMMDPTLIAGKASKTYKFARYGILDGSEAFDAVARLNKIYAVADGTTLGRSMEEVRGVKALTSVSDVNYDAKLLRDTAKLNPAQRAAVSMADHANAYFHGDKRALGLFGQRFAGGKRLAEAFMKDTLRSAVAENRAVIEVTPDDVIDFYKKADNMAGLLSGQAMHKGMDLTMVPTLSRLGSARILAKMEMYDLVNWENRVMLKLRTPLEAADAFDPDTFANTLRQDLADSGKITADDGLRILNDELAAQGVQPLARTRAMNRHAAEVANIELLDGEDVLHGLLRSIVAANGPEEADDIRRIWTEAVSVSTGKDPEQAAEWVQRMEHSYRDALGIGDDADAVFDRMVSLGDAVRVAADSGDATQEAFTKNSYLMSLREAGTDSDTLDAASEHFDRLVAQRKAIQAGDPVDATNVDPRRGETFRRMVKIPVMRAITAPLRLGREVASFIPRDNFIMFDEVDRMEKFQQLLDTAVYGPEAEELYGKFLLATDAGQRAIIRDVHRTIFDRLGILRDPDYKEFVDSWLDPLTQHYGWDDLVTDTEGNMHAAGWLPDSHRAYGMKIISYREVQAQVKRNRMMALLNGYGNKVIGINSQAAEGSMRLWRRAVVARLASIPRNAGEEFFNQYARLGLGYAFKQGVVSHLVALAPETARRVGARQLREAAELLDSTVAAGGIGDVYSVAELATKAGAKEGFRNQIHLLSEVIKQRMAPITGTVLSPEHEHAARMLAVDEAVQKSASMVGGKEHGIVASALDGDGAPTNASALILNDKGEQVWFSFKRDGTYDTFTDKNDILIKVRYDNALKLIQADQAGKIGFHIRAHYVDPTMARLISDTAEARLLPTVEHDNPNHLVTNLRDGLTQVDEPTRDALIDWIDRGSRRPKRTVRDVEKARGLPEGALEANSQNVSANFPVDKLDPEQLQPLRDILGNQDLTWRNIGDLLEELPNPARQALMVTPRRPLPLHIGLYGDLLDNGLVYKGGPITDLDRMLEHGANWDEVARNVRQNSKAGPGFYITSDGVVAEAGGWDGTDVQRFRWKKGKPIPRFIDGAGDAHQVEMEQQMVAVTADVIRAAVPGMPGQILADAMNQGHTSERVAQIAEQIGVGLSDNQKRAIVETVRNMNEALLEAAPARSVKEAIQHERDVLKLWLAQADEYRATLNVQPHAFDETFNTAYGKHVVDHFKAKGFGGISEFAGDGARFSVALWDPSHLTHVGAVPYKHSLANNILEARTFNTEQALRAAGRLEGEAAERAYHQIAVDEIERYLATRDLSHMDYMSRAMGVLDAPPVGFIRVNIPMIPDATVRAMADKLAQTRGSAPAALGAATGAATELERAQRLAELVPDASVSPWLQDMINRSVAGVETEPMIAGRLAIQDPVHARLVLNDLRAEVEQVLGVGFDDGMHLGYVDLQPSEYHALISGVPTGDVGQISARIGRSAVATEMVGGRAVTAGPTDVKWIDDDMVLNRGLSYHTDDPAMIMPEVGVEDRKAAASTLGRLNALPSVQEDMPRFPLAKVTSDQDLLFALRQELVRTTGTDPIHANAVLEAVAAGLPDQAAVDALTAAHGENVARTAQELLALPESMRPYLFEQGTGASTIVNGKKVGPTAWAMADGKTYLERQRELADRIASNIAKTVTGEDGKPIHAVLRPLADDTYKYRIHLGPHDAVSLPAEITGPQMRVARKAGPISGRTNRFMSFLGNGISYFSRHPAFTDAYAKSLSESEPILRSMRISPELAEKVDGLVTDTKKAKYLLYETRAAAGGHLTDSQALEILVEADLYKPASNLVTYTLDSKTNQIVREVDDGFTFTDDEKAIVNWWRSEEALMDETREIAKIRAVKAVIPYIDDHQIRSQFAEKIHNVIPFWFAEDSFYRRWGRTFIHTPEAYRRMQLAHNALRASGVLKENEYGEEVFEYPGMAIASKALAHFVDAVTPGHVFGEFAGAVAPDMVGQLKFAAPGFDRIGAPSPGPLVALPVYVLRRAFPEIGLPVEEKLLGERGAGRSIWASVLPSAIYHVINVGQMGEDDLASATIGAIQMLEATHPEMTPPPGASATDINVYMDTVRNYARFLLMFKAITGFAAPAAPQFDFDPNDLNKEFVDALEAGVPIEQAHVDFLERHPDATAYTLFKTENPSKAPADPTEKTYDAIIANQDFYDHYASSSWLLPEAPPEDKFDRKAWYEMLAHKLRTRKSDIEFYKDMKYAEAADDYFNSKADKDAAFAAAKGDRAQRRYIAQSWNEWKEDYFTAHRIFAEKLMGHEGHSTRVAIIQDLRNALQDPAAPDTPQKKILASMVESWFDYKAMRARLGGTTAELRQKALMKETFMEWAERVSAGNPTARTFYQRMLYPEIDPGHGYAADQPTDDEEGVA